MFFFFQAEDGIRDHCVTGVQTCALPILKESNAHHNYQQAIVEAQETDTVVIERSIGRPARVLKGRMSERILEVEGTLDMEHASADERLQRLLPFILGKVNTRAALEGVLDEGYVWTGQVIGQIGRAHV